MAQYSFLSKEEINEKAIEFDLGKVQNFKVLSGGSENTNYIISTKKGKFVLSICEQKSLEETLELARLLHYLSDNSFKTSRIVSNKSGKLTTICKGKPAMIKIYEEGKVFESLPNVLIESLGKELGRLHKIEAPNFLPKQLNYGKENFRAVEKYAKGSEFDYWLKAKYKFFIPYINSDLKKTIIHGDVFSNNVVVNDDEKSLTIIDFEEATFYYRVFDLGMTIIGTCHEGKTINLNKVQHLLSGYSQEVSLSNDELDSLKAFTVYAGASMTFWRHMNFNYTTPNSSLFDHYKGLQILTDFVHNLPEESFKFKT
tara:strand:- start:3335 stop:4273 length:939 start_codon:yes stop_codon:yes gene_type:complete